jgi:hypothetical protein
MHVGIAKKKLSGDSKMGGELWHVPIGFRESVLDNHLMWHLLRWELNIQEDVVLTKTKNTISGSRHG